VIVKRLENETKTASASSSPTTPPRSPTRAKCWPSAPASERQGRTDRPEREGRRPRAVRQVRGQTVKVDGDELLVMKEDDLFAVVEK
jgi:chaperonin GroES